VASKEPEYLLESKFGEIEVRNYQPMMVAEVTVTGSMQEASSSGFKVLADFIFGNNCLPNGQREKISMTVPVVISKKQQAWNFHFVMPGSYTMKSLPKPNSPLIAIKQISAKKCIVLKFSGTVNEALFFSKSAQLLDWAKQAKFKVLGDPELARYNPPWTLPFLRRNEILIEVE
jgi:effector-binding domain-containing protein